MPGSMTCTVGRVTGKGRSGESKRHVPPREKTISPRKVPCPTPINLSVVTTVVGVVPGLRGGKRPEQVTQVAVTVAVFAATSARASISVVSHVRGGEGDTVMPAS
jgi:hypothetical protein